MSRIIRLIAASFLCLATTLPVHADTLVGRIVKVTDGDTVQVLGASKTTHKSRLAGVDAPESGQAFGTKAKPVSLGFSASRELQKLFLETFS